MKRIHFLIPAAFLLFAGLFTCLLPGCKEDDDPDDSTTKDPLWTYDTQEDPYGSKPWIAGNKLVVCSIFNESTNPSEGYDNIWNPGAYWLVYTGFSEHSTVAWARVNFSNWQ